MRSRQTRAGRKRRWIASLLLLTGLILVGIWVWSQIHGAVYQDWESWVFEKTRHGQRTAVSDYLSDKAAQLSAGIRERLQGSSSAPAPPPAPPPQQAERRPQPQPALREGQVIGRLIVPRLHLRAIVREGTGKSTLDVALGHISGTALPGQNGNVGVAGHRDTLFRALRGIRTNDLIQFQTLSGDYLYRVGGTEIVTPKSVGVLRPGPSPEMTLVTCWPFNYIGSAPDRFIVKAQLVSQGSPAPAAAALAPRQPERRTARPVQPVNVALNRRPGRVEFQLTEKHSRELAPGISMGLSWADPYSQRIDGWMWIMPDRRTIWLRGQNVREPIVFYGHSDGKMRKLVITKVRPGSVSGYLVVGNSESD